MIAAKSLILANSDLLDRRPALFSAVNYELEQVFDKIMGDFEERSVYFIIEDDQPQSFYPCILKNTPLKILFRLWYPQNKSLKLNQNELECLESLPNRQVLVLNKLTGERFRFRL